MNYPHRKNRRPDDIWNVYGEKYPMPDGFEDSTYGNDATPSYEGFGHKFKIWMHDAATFADVWGAEEPFTHPFAIEFSHVGEIWGGVTQDDLPDYQERLLETWDEVLAEIKEYAAVATLDQVQRELY